VAVPARQLVGEVLAAALEEMVEARVAPLRLELERMRARSGPELVPFADAARRLGKTLRHVQRGAADGRLEVEVVGGVRMVRLPAGTPPR
jgi:hypothetical protein